MGCDQHTEIDLDDLIWGDDAGAAEMRIPPPSFKRLVAAGVIRKFKIPGYKRNGYLRSELRKVPEPV